MVRIAISAAFVAAVIGFASALSVEQRAAPLVQTSLKKISTVSNSTHIVARDMARLSKYFKKSAVSELTASTPVINEVFSYVAETTVGSQTFDLIVDTGSSNTWVGATTKFKSGSGTSTGASVSVSYGSGSFSGTEYTAAVAIGSTGVTKQSIGVAKTATGFTGVDGIVGFGPEDLTEDTVSGATEVPTFMQTLLSEGVISENILGVSFAVPSGSSDDSSNGELTFGGVDDTKYTGSISYTDRTGDYWGVAASEWEFGSTSLGTSTAQGIVDTGTTLMLVPTAVYDKFLTASEGKADSSTGLVKFTTKPTSDFKFVVGGTTYTLTPTQYLIPTAQYSNWGITGSDFYTFIGDGGSEAPNTILGQSFLEHFYSVFDTTNDRVGLAVAA